MYNLNRFSFVKIGGKFRILYDIERPGDDLTGYRAKSQKAATAPSSRKYKSNRIFFYKTEELFRILYGIERPGDDWKCGHASAQKAAAAGVGAHRLERPPIADQMHVVVWVIKAIDIRFEQRKYREITNFVLHQLKRECK